eukprot:gb/GEZN01009455.1/.p1 GENE.gb/GEZN01009455.1/~~gb/GEZN01009455.1/.p1  ORF type:complete len:331 (-),score=34.02 gb/GEZN01009455.1/:307-1299(-)
MTDAVVEGDVAFRDILYKLSTTRLINVPPRPKDRSKTLWRTAITIKENDSLKKAFIKLADNNILCLPVIGSLSGKVVGELHTSHILSWIVNNIDANPDLTTMDEFFKRLDTTHVAAIYDDVNYHTCRGQYSVYHAAEIMARTNAKRVIVTNKRDKVRGIFTQSMMIGELFSNINLLNASSREMKVRKMTKSYWVYSIREDARTIDAFRQMNDWGRTALAVTDEKGACVDELSEKDLKALTVSASSYMRLYSSVKDYKDFVRRDARKKGKKIPHFPQLVTEDDTFEKVITLMDGTPCHRVFVVDNMRQKQPQYVITQADILRQIFPSFGGW